MINVISLNFKRTDLSVRSYFQFSNTELDYIYRELKSMGGLKGLVILSTCNRTELYLHHENVYTVWALLNYLQQYKGVYIPLEHFEIVWETEPAVAYMAEVANGLHSLAVGDKQIIGQFKKAFLQAQSYKMITGPLERIFQVIFRSHKRITNETVYHSGSKSISHLAIDSLKKDGKNRHSKILVVGAGAIASDLLKYLHAQKFNDVTVINRTSKRAELLASRYSFNTIGYNVSKDFISEFHVVISCIAADDAIDCTSTDNSQQLLIDITTYHSFKLNPKFQYYKLVTLDTLSKKTMEVDNSQLKAITVVRQIIQSEISVFLLWYESRKNKIRSNNYAYAS